MKIRLDKEKILSIFCLSFQGERSIAFGLGARWEEVRDYYKDERLLALAEFASDLEKASNLWKTKQSNLDREGLAPIVPKFTTFLYLFGHWISNWRKQWSFPAEIVAFMVAKLKTLVQVLNDPMRPSDEELISLRMDLCFSRSLIEERCFGLKELKLANRMEHFGQAPWVTPATIKDVVGEASWLTPIAVRQSA